MERGGRDRDGWWRWDHEAPGARNEYGRPIGSGGTPGKRTLIERMVAPLPPLLGVEDLGPHQVDDDHGVDDVTYDRGDAPHATLSRAERGLAGGASRLPHLDAIQRSFGHHDVRGARA